MVDEAQKDLTMSGERPTLIVVEGLFFEAEGLYQALHGSIQERVYPTRTTSLERLDKQYMVLQSHPSSDVC